MRPIRQGDGTGLSASGFSEVRKGDGTVLWSAGSDIRDSETVQLSTVNNNEFTGGDRVGFIFEAAAELNSVEVVTENTYNNGHADVRIESHPDGSFVAGEAGTFSEGSTHTFSGLSLDSGAQYRVTVDGDGNQQMADLNVTYPQATEKELLKITSGYKNGEVSENWTFAEITVSS